MTKNILITSLLLSLSPLAFSQEERSWRATVGAGVVFKKNMRFKNTYEDMDKKYFVKPIPFVQGSIGRFSITGLGVSVLAVGNPMMNVSAFVKRDGDRYHGLGMIPRKDSVFVGATAKFFNYGFSLSHDINGRSKGYIATANYAQFWPVAEAFMIRGAVSLDWLDDRYAEYYYGVRKTEATTDRREYHLTNYFLPGVSVMPIYKLSEKTSLTGILSAKILPKKVSDSPTMIGKRFEYAGIVTVGYTF